MGRVVQNDSLGEIPPEDAQIFDVVAENAGTIVLIQTVSRRENTDELKTPATVGRVPCQSLPLSFYN